MIALNNRPGVQIWLEGITPYGEWVFMQELSPLEAERAVKRHRPDRYRIVRATVEITWGGVKEKDNPNG